jgi:hypothetical protein
VYLSSLIREAYSKNGVVVAYVYGNMGYGKTSYSFWVAYEVLKSWDRVLDYTFFDLNEAIETMWRHIERGERLPIMVFDDAGLWLNRLTWWREEKVRFMKLFNLARTISAGIIFTTPSEEIPRQIMNKCNYRVVVKPLEEGEVKVSESAKLTLETARKFGVEAGGVAVARGYQLILLPSFFKLVKKEFLDYYPLWYPIFREYTRLRLQYVKHKLRELREAQSKSREKLLEEAIELYKRTGDLKRVYYLKTKLSQSTAYRWAYQRIPAIIKLRAETSGQGNRA